MKKLYVVLVLTLASSHSARADSEATNTNNEDINNGDTLDTADTDNQSRNFFLGTFIKIGGDLLGIAGNLAKHTGDWLHSSASLLEEGGDTVASVARLGQVGANIGHGGDLLHTAARALTHGGHLVNKDQNFMTEASRNLVCVLVCPLKHGHQFIKCKSENCDIRKSKKPSEQIPEPAPAMVVRQGRTITIDDEDDANDRVDEKMTASLLDMGHLLLSAATNILTDIAFIKLKILQGLFAHPDCEMSKKNDNNQCISQLCNYTEQRPKIYIDNYGSCITNQEYLSPDRVIVDTVHGPVVGEILEDYDIRFKTDISWTSFTGIPYAAPPVGHLRFKPPQPPLKWSCPLDATKKRNTICPQLNFGLDNEGLLDGSTEDCLYLNVYVPDSARNHSRPLPVAVWLHGGAFMFGSGSACWFGPQFWIVHDIILVTLNYRLGPLGFLSLGNSQVPGNAGMLDQVAALQWVQDNIHRFGGDPDNVTLMGQSAGSFSTTYHLVSPKSKGLFKRIIAQSGVGGFSPSYHHYNEWQAVKYGNEASALVGCLDASTRVHCLKRKKVSEVMTMDIRNELFSQPVVDGHFTDDPFLPDDPKKLIREGKYHQDVEILLGFNEEEGHMVTSVFEAFPLLYSAMAAGWPVLGPFSLLGKHHTEMSEHDVHIVNKILLEYVGNVSAIKAENIEKITNMFTDSFFSYGINKFLDMHLPKAHTKTYQYIFSYKEHSRASHSSELPLLWGIFKGRQQIFSEGEIRMSKFLTTMWSNFIKFGNPTPRPVDRVKWKPSTVENREYLLIGNKMHMEYLSNSLLSRLKIWKAALND